MSVPDNEKTISETCILFTPSWGYIQNNEIHSAAISVGC